MAIDSNSSPPFDLGKLFEDPSDILEICSSLVSVEDVETQRHHQNEGDTDTDANEDDDSFNDGWSDTDTCSVNNKRLQKNERYRNAKITLAHFSVKEYLVSDRIRHGPAFAYSLKEEVSNESIAEDCLVYVLHLIEPDVWRSTLTSVEYPLARYAARYWIDHIQFVEGPKSTALTLAQELFLTREEIFVNWIQLWDPDRPSWGTNTELRMYTGPPLYYASLLGFLESVEVLVDNGADVNAQGGFYGNALIAASTSGHIEIVKLLVEKGATINSFGTAYGGTALEAASFEGHIEIVQLLLHKAVDIVAHNRSNLGISLEAASTAGHTEIVRFPFDKTAHIDALRVQGALKRACNKGDERTVQLLLDSGAVVDLMSLAAALRSGEAHVLRLLLEHGYHLERTPLHWAAKGGVTKNIKILEEAGAKSSNENIGGRTPSDVAVFHNRDITRHFNAGTNPCLERGVQTQYACDGCDQVCKP